MGYTKRIAFFILALWVIIVLGSLTHKIQQFAMEPNSPVQAGVPVTFTVLNDGIGEEPEIAWDFGDGSGLQLYKKGWSATHVYTEPGVYYVFARIKDVDIPLYVVQTVTRTILKPAPTHSTTISLDTLHKKVWSVNPDNNSVSLIDPLTNQMVAEVPTGKKPRTVAVDKDGNAWVANQDAATITVISKAGSLVRNIELPYGSRPFGICFDPLKDFVYVTLEATGELIKIDPVSGNILSSVDVGRSPRGIAITSNGQKILVTQFISPADKGLVREVNAQTMTVSKVIELAFDQTPDFEDRGRGVPNYLSSITISPDGKEAWVPSKKDNTARGLFRDGQELTFDNTVRTIVSKIDMATGTEILSARIDINDADMACAVEFSPYGNLAFVALQGNNKVEMVDVDYHSRLGSLDNTGLAPQGMTLSADGTRLYVQNFMSRNVKVFNIEDIILGNNQVGTAVDSLSTILTDSLSPEVLLGKQIFYNAEDERMTFAGYISCASCHLDGGSDERVWDFTDRGEGFRNTHSLLGRRGTGMGNVHWTSNFDEIQDFENDMRNAFKGKGFLPDEVFNANNVSDPLGTPKAGLSPELDALAAYVASLDEVHPSPYRNQDGSLTQEAVAGKLVFAELGCGNCHSGPDFTDRASGLMHDVGTIEISSGKRRNAELPGFGTPTLKGIWETAPYLHDGSAPTLRDVLTTRNKDGKHGDISTLTELEIDNLIAYLKQIDESEADVVTALHYEKNIGKDELTLGPNPVSDIVYIDLSYAVKASGTLEIINLGSGKRVYTQKVQNKERYAVDVSQFSDGAYLVKFSNAKISRTGKLVIRR